MKLFQACNVIKHLLEADHNIWLCSKTQLKIFITEDARFEGVSIDTHRKIFVFPVPIREQVSTVHFNFDSDSIDLLLSKQMPLSVLYQHKKVSAHGDAYSVFNASIFIMKLFRLVSQVHNEKEICNDSYRLH